MQFSKWKIGAVALVCMLLPGSVHAQIVKNERLLSFEEKQVPAFVTTAAGSQLGISDEHYRSLILFVSMSLHICKTRNCIHIS